MSDVLLFHPKTVKIINDEVEAGFVIINEADFNPEVHELFEEPGAEAPVAKRKK